MELVEIGNLEAIRKFFEKDGGRKVSTAELKALTTEERNELGNLSREMLTEEERFKEVRQE